MKNATYKILIAIAISLIFIACGKQIDPKNGSPKESTRASESQRVVDGTYADQHDFYEFRPDGTVFHGRVGRTDGFPGTYVLYQDDVVIIRFADGSGIRRILRGDCLQGREVTGLYTFCKVPPVSPI